MMSELKPCPFCWGEANMVDEGSECAPDRFWACCPNPSCFVEGTGVYSTEEKAAEAWNARWERTCHDSYDGREFGCSECGAVAHLLIRDEAGEWQRAMPDRCPACGAKVVSE